MGILGHDAIMQRIKADTYENRLVITPLLSEKQIGPGSVDIRLGSTIIIHNRTYIESLDPANSENFNAAINKAFKKLKLQYHKKIVLHPHEVILAATFEYISLPHNIFATIASRSSWGRLGLVIATASVVQPGFKGSLTLELSNLSDTPIALYPGLSIGQLVLHDVLPAKPSGLKQRGLKEDKTWERSPLKYTTRYSCPTEAEVPNFYDEEVIKELQFWGGYKSPRNSRKIK